MKQKHQNFCLLGMTLLVLVVVLEAAFRFYWIPFFMLIQDASRKQKVAGSIAEMASFAQSKGVTEKTFNIYFLGDSTMWGEPYTQETAIPKLVKYRLRDQVNGQPAQFINFGKSAKDIAYIRYLMEQIVRKSDLFHPSLFVIYSGHNEFLKFHPTEPDRVPASFIRFLYHFDLLRYLLTTGARSMGETLEIDQRLFFDYSLFPHTRDGYDKVIQHYERHIEGMIERAQKHSIPIIFSTVVNNEANWEPNRSVFCSSSSDQEQKFTQLFQSGLAAEAKRDWKGAIHFYQEALTLCGSFAEVHFRLGKIWESLSDYKKAAEEFQMAIDQDAMPIRVVSAQNKYLRSLTERDQVIVVDSLAYLKTQMPNGLLDERLISDGIHPTMEGYLMISEIMAETIRANFAAQSEGLEPLEMDTLKQVFKVGKKERIFSSLGIGRWITRLATWRYLPDERLEKAETTFREVIAIDPNRYEGYLGLGVVAYLRKNVSSAQTYIEKARALDKAAVDKYLRHVWIRKIIQRANASAGKE